MPETLFCAKLTRLHVLLISTAILMPQSGWAQDIVIPSGDTVTVPQTLDNVGDTLTVESGGAIDVTGFGLDAVEGKASDQSIVNHGSIFLNDAGSSDGSAIRSKGDNASVVNTGSIEAENIAIGIRSDGNFSTVTNSGSIDADSYGIRSTGSNATITNTGIINALNHGIRSDGDHANVINRGTVNGDSQGIVVDIHGIRNGGAFSTVTNYGMVSGDEDGIFSIGDNATIINHGTVVGQKAGIGSQGDNSRIVNYGTVRTDGGPYAIGIIGIGTELVVMPGSTIEGSVSFEGIDEKLTIAAGQNVVLDYAGVFTTLDVTTPFVNDTSNGVVVTVDPTGFATANPWLQTLTQTIQDTVRQAADPDAVSSRSVFGFGGESSEAGGPRGWISGFGGYQSQSGSGAVTGADQTYGGGIAGGHAAYGSNIYGLFAGGSRSHFETDNNAQTIAVTSAFGGLYGSIQHSSWRYDLALAAGYAQHDSTRNVANNMVAGGRETASADYDGYFLSPALSATRQINDRTFVTIGGRYAALFLDGYQETGSSANLSVSSRTVQVAALNAEMLRRLGQWNNDSGTLTLDGWLGANGLFNLGDNSVDATVAGLPLDFSGNFAGTTAVGVAGIGMGFRPHNGALSVNIEVEGRLGSDDYREVRGAGRIGWRF